MHNFDVRTLILVAGILYLVMPAFTWFYLRKLRTGSVDCWCLGGLLIGVGASLAAFAGQSPNWVAYELILSLFMASHFLRMQALWINLRQAKNWRWLVLIATLLLVLINVVGLGLGNKVLAAQISNTIAGVCYLVVARLSWQISTGEHSRSALWIACVYSLLSLAFGYRVIVLFFTQGSADMVVNHLPSALVALAGLLSAVIGHFGYVGMELERALRRELAEVASRVRAHQEGQLSEHFARLDNQRSLDDLPASLAHELSQPLAAILTNAQVALLNLGKPQPNAELTASVLRKMAQSTERACKILPSENESTGLPRSMKDVVDLNQIVQEVVGLVTDQIQERNITFALDLPADPAWVRIDSLQASQVLLNLFQNAIDALSTVKVRKLAASVVTLGESTVFRLQDTGGGLTDEALLRSGQAFFTSKQYGLGMGLNISRSIAMRFGGSLNLSNFEADGTRGVIAKLSLPGLQVACI